MAESPDAVSLPSSVAGPLSVEPAALPLHVAIGASPSEHTLVPGQLVTWISVLSQVAPKLSQWQDADPLQHLEYVFVPQLLGPAVP
jgi:hypothetical protein